MPRKEVFLTERQIQILRLRKEGFSQAKIAEKLGTSRANISATEKVANNNIQRAKNTLDLVKFVEAPIWISLEPESDVNDAVEELYRKADSEGIRVSHSFPSLSEMIRMKAGEKVKGRKVLKKLEIAVARDGEIIVR